VIPPVDDAAITQEQRMTTTPTSATTCPGHGPADRPPNPLRRALRRFAATRAGAELFARALPPLDRQVYRLTSGRQTAAALLSGLPVVGLTTIGARSGVPRTAPVIGFPVPEGLAVIASHFGRARQPAWFHNLCAHPDVHVTVAGATHPVHAVLATGELRDRVWQAGLRVFPGWSAYERRARPRAIGVFVLVPRSPAQPSTSASSDPRPSEGTPS
jgi:deazaflavin-dependent oxidoreductase (nitroreductase family)